MDKRYLIYKCSPDGRRVITRVTGYDLEEAREALRWLQQHHEDEADFRLEEGEFFEILEESHIPANEWQEAMVRLKIKN